MSGAALLLVHRYQAASADWLEDVGGTRHAQVSVVTWRVPGQFFSFSKLLVAVSGPVSVDELVSVENAPSAPLRSAPGFR